MQVQFPKKINGGVVFSFFSFDMSVKKTNFAAEKMPPYPRSGYLCISKDGSRWRNVKW